jgi:Zn-dependent peptidase ImmA (M78 family)
MFEPKVLRWAREGRFGPTRRALEAKLGDSNFAIDIHTIEQWEDGIATPTFADVKKLAQLYKRPLAVFFLDSPPDTKTTPPDHRTIGSEDNKDISPEGLLVMRKARRTQEIAAMLQEASGEPSHFKFSKHSITEDPDSLALKVREDLGLSIRKQFKFRKYEEFFEYLREKIEDAGVITLKSGMHDSFPVEDCRAFSFADSLPYLILINNKDYEGSKNFSLAHELAHILVREAGVCNNFRTFDIMGKKIDELEVFCNRFAAALLVPENEFRAHPLLRERANVSSDHLDDEIQKIALDFKISRVVILRRLLAFGLITQVFYNEKVNFWKEDPPPRRGKSGRFSLSTLVKKNGRSFSSLVFESYRNKKISFTSAAEYLGIKRKHMSGFERLLRLS